MMGLGIHKIRQRRQSIAEYSLGMTHMPFMHLVISSIGLQSRIIDCNGLHGSSLNNKFALYSVSDFFKLVQGCTIGSIVLLRYG